MYVLYIIYKIRLHHSFFYHFLLLFFYCAYLLFEYCYIANAAIPCLLLVVGSLRKICGYCYYCYYYCPNMVILDRSSTLLASFIRYNPP